MPGEPYDRIADLSRPNPSGRVGATVVHPAQPWTASTHALLRHLESVEYPASQRIVGFDKAGNEVLTWIDGVVHAQSVWPQPERSLFTVGRLLRDLHRSTASFDPPADAVWMPWTLRSSGPGTVVSHGNIAPWHVVFRDEEPVGFIGWEYAGPVDPLEEVAATGWFCAQLFDEDVAARVGLPDTVTRGHWLKAFLDGYELPALPDGSWSRSWSSSRSPTPDCSPAPTTSRPSPPPPNICGCCRGNRARRCGCRSAAAS